MTISYSQLAGFVGMLQDASRDEKLWLAFDARIQMPSVNDLQLFYTRSEANDFAHFNKLEGRTITLLPVEATRYFLHESARTQLQEGIPSPLIQLDEVAIYSIYDEMLFQQSIVTLEEQMDGFDWSKTFYDPLEANTEAESLEDKIAFNRLEFLVEQLSSFSQTGDRARAAVADLMQRHWAGQGMEVQTENVLRGDYRLKNESLYVNYGINPDAATMLLSTSNNQFMNMENLSFLKKNIKDTGFGESLHAELEKNIQEKKSEFQLHFTTQVNNRPFNATLQFRKSDTSDMYFFNRYVASIERSNGEKIEHSFEMRKGKGVKSNEAYNMLQGRAVKKELTNSKGEAYQAWMQLDFDKKDEKGRYVVNKYNDNYGYDLREEVGRLPIKELDGAEKEKDLLRSLERGYMQGVTIDHNGAEQKLFIEANPARKTLNVYDEKFVMQKHENLPMAPRPQKEAKQETSTDTTISQNDNQQQVKEGKKSDTKPDQKTRTRKARSVKM